MSFGEIKDAVKMCTQKRALAFKRTHHKDWLKSGHKVEQVATACGCVDLVLSNLLHFMNYGVDAALETLSWQESRKGFVDWLRKRFSINTAA